MKTRAQRRYLKTVREIKSQKIARKRGLTIFKKAWVDTFTSCSCSMCCNPRKHGLKTLQELRYAGHLKDCDRQLPQGVGHG